MEFFKNFKEFAVKGNVIDLAVGVIIGTAFGKIVSSLVADVVMPAIGLIVGGISFSNLTYTHKNLLSGEEVVVKYGNFLQSAFDFLVIALAIFIFVSLLNRALKKPAKNAPAPVVPADVLLLTEIRDALVGKSADTPSKRATKSTTVSKGTKSSKKK